VLQSFLGEKAGAYIYRSANGISDSPVKSERDAAKSYSNETTFSPDITAEDFERRAPEIVRWLSESVGRRIRRDQIYVNTIDVSVKTNEFKRRSRQKKLSDATDCTAVIEEEAMKMLRELCMGQHGVLSDGTGIRLIGVGGSGIEDGSYRQMNLFDLMESSESKSSSKLDQMVDELEHKFGRGIVQKGGDF
jgi:DNA polymerase-4